MQLNTMQLTKTLSASVLLAALFAVAALPAMAADTAPAKATAAKKGNYSETDFLRAFSGKSRQVVTERLGKPVKKEQSVMPSNAAGVVGKQLDTSKPVNVEMWYYNNLVEYSPKKTYKVTELTFVNDRCMNIAFFNNR
jgi:opacity protein-like surface antigen